jgi:hypothetical protein
MKKLYFLLMGVFLTTSIFSQTTVYTEDFTKGIEQCWWNGGPPCGEKSTGSIYYTTTDGVISMKRNAGVSPGQTIMVGFNVWTQNSAGVWVNFQDNSATKKVYVKAKSKTGGTLTLSLSGPEKKAPSTVDSVSAVKEIIIDNSDKFKVYELNFTNDLGTLSNFNLVRAFFLGSGGNEADIIDIDYIKLGFDPDFTSGGGGGTVVGVQTLNLSMDTAASSKPKLTASTGYNAAIANSELTVTGTATKGQYELFSLNFPNVINNTANNKFFIRMKAGDATTKVRIDAVDVNGKATNADNVTQTKTLTQSYVTYEFDFTGKYKAWYGTGCSSANPCTVKGDSISGLQMYINPGTAGITSAVVIDFIRGGADTSTTVTTTPTCTDGIKNGNETGIDCGGSCPVCPTTIPSTWSEQFASTADKNYSYIWVAKNGAAPAMYNSVIANNEWSYTATSSKENGWESQMDFYYFNGTVMEGGTPKNFGTNKKLFVKAKTTTPGSKLRLNVYDSLGAKTTLAQVELTTAYKVYELDLSAPANLNLAKIRRIGVLLNEGVNGKGITSTDTASAANAIIDWISANAPLETITAALAATIAETKGISCFGDKNGTLTAIASGGTSPYKYAWSSAATDTTAEVKNLGVGVYKVTITDKNNTKFEVSYELKGPAAALNSTAVIVNEIGTTKDGKITLTATGGTSPYTYKWSNNATTKDLTGLSAGKYTVTVTDKNGCVSTKEYTVTMTTNLNELDCKVTQSSLFSDKLDLNLCFENNSVRIVDLNGREVYNEVNVPINHAIQTSNWQSGIYFIRLTESLSKKAKVLQIQKY